MSETSSGVGRLLPFVTFKARKRKLRRSARWHWTGPSQPIAGCAGALVNCFLPTLQRGTTRGTLSGERPICSVN